MNLILDIKSLSKSYNNRKNIVVKNVNLSVEKGKILVIVGESGSGKTTLIRLITGLTSQDEGIIILNNKIVTSDSIFIRPEKRNIGMVFQDYALFPHLTVYKNIAYGITSSVNKVKTVKEVLKLVGLEGYENRFPHQLSGGQQQRVSLARAIAPKPQLLILDEPFSNLDHNLRIQLREEVFDIIKKSNVTSIFVTHDTEDATAVADKIAVLKDGEIVQQGTTESFYKKPKNVYVASLFSSIVKLTNYDLEYFGYHSGTLDKTYAITFNNFEINKDCDYSTNLIILKSKHFRDIFLNTALLPNNKHLNFYSDINLSEKEVNLGFNKESLLVFNKDLKG